MSVRTVKTIDDLKQMLQRVLKPVTTVADKCDNLSQKSETVAEKYGSRRISPLSRRFLRQSHFSATVWTRL